MSDASPASPLDDRAYRSDVYVLSAAVLLLMLVAAVDAFNFFDRPNGGLRYTILVIPFAAVVFIRARHPSLIVRRPSPPDLLLGMLFLFGFSGALIGVAIRGNLANSYPVFLPMTVGLLFLLAVDGPTEDEVGRLLDRLANVGAVYVVMNFLVNTGLLPGLAHYLKYRNASAAIVAMALTAALVRRRWRRLAFLSFLFAVIFMTYPSATQVLMSIAVVLTLAVTTRRSGGLRTLILATVVALFVVLALVNLNTGIRLTTSYFAGVSKSNSDTGRLDLWTAGVDEFLSSPWIGQAFTGESIAIRTRDQKALPFHNDFVLFLAQGGVVGFGLLLTWIGVTELTLLRRFRAFRDAGFTDAADLTRIILVTLNCFFVSMAFNPTLEGVTRTATLFGLYGIAVSLGTPDTMRAQSRAAYQPTVSANPSGSETSGDQPSDASRSHATP